MSCFWAAAVGALVGNLVGVALLVVLHRVGALLRDNNRKRGRRLR